MVDLKQIRQTAQADFKRAEDKIVAEEVKAVSWFTAHKFEIAVYAAIAFVAFGFLALFI